MIKALKLLSFVLAFLIITDICLPITASIASEAGIKKVIVNDNGKKTQYTTKAKTIENLFDEQNIKLYAKDVCSHALHEKAANNMIINITRGFYVTVSIDAVEERKKVSPETTVDGLMNQLQREYDIALVYDGDADAEIQENDYLAFQTWRSEWFVTTLDIPYTTETIETTAIIMGLDYIRQEGSAGKRQITFAVIYIGGVEHHREIMENIVIEDSIPEIIDKGIGGKLGTTTNVNSPSFRYTKKMTMNASAYTAGYESTGKRPGDKGYGITFSGLPVEVGIVSVDPNVIPLGTRLYVEGYGFSLAADTGSAIKGNKIDLYYESVADSLEFGRRNVTVYVLD